MGGLTGGNTVQQTKSYTPNPLTMQMAYGDYGALQNALNQPWSNMPVQPVAGFSPDQLQAFQQFRQLQGGYQPYFDAAQSYLQKGASPVSESEVSQYFDPYYKQALGALEDTQGAQEASAVGSDVQAAGGIGADRIGVSDAERQRQFGLARGQLASQTYQAALQAAQQDKQRQEAASSLEASYGPAWLQSAMAGASGLYGMGSQQQQLQQAMMNAPYNWLVGQFQYPAYLAQLGSGITGQLGGVLGGSQTGQTIYPQQSPWAAGLGLGMQGLGLAGKLGWSPFGGGSGSGKGSDGVPMSWAGGRIRKAHGGSVHDDDGFWSDLHKMSRHLGYADGGDVFVGPSSNSLSDDPLGRYSGKGGSAGGGGSKSSSGGLGDLVNLGSKVPWGSIGSGIGDALGSIGSGIGDALGSIGGDLAGLFGGGEAAAGLGELGDLALLAVASGGVVNPYPFVGYAEGGKPKQLPLGTALDLLANTHDEYERGLGSINGIPLIARPYRGPNQLQRPAKPGTFQEGGDVGDDDIDNPDSPYNFELTHAPAGSKNLSQQHVSYIDADGNPVDLPPVVAPETRGLPKAVSSYAATGDDTDTGDTPIVRSALSGRLMPDQIPLPPMPSIPQMPQRGPFGGGDINDFLMRLGAGMAAGAGRDAHGLPIGGSPFGQFAHAAGAGLNTALDYGEKRHQADLADWQNQLKVQEFMDKAGMQRVPYVTMTAAQRAAQAQHEEQFGLEKERLELERQKAKDLAAYRERMAGAPKGGYIWDNDLQQWVLPGGATQAKSPTVNKGDDVADPVPVGNLSTDSIKTLAGNFLQTGKLPTGFSGSRDPLIREQRTAIVNHATALAASRGLTPDQVSEMWRLAPRQAGWLMGPDGRQAGALGTLVDHLDTLRGLAAALKNGETQIPNWITNKLKVQFGDAAPTNIELASQIVGAEVLKAIGVAGAGGESEREAAAAVANIAKSPEQSIGGIDTVQKLAAGQLRTKQRQAQAIGLSEDKLHTLVGDRAWNLLGSLDSGTGAGATKKDPAARFNELTKEGRTKEEAYSIMKSEGY